MQRVLKIILSLFLIISFLSACAKDDGNNYIVAKVYKNAKFDCANLELDEDDFTNAGFSFGDSFNISFPDGTVYEDVPYFSGYYVKTGCPVIVSYPGNGYVLIANNNSDLWSLLDLKDNDEVKIELVSKGKYLSVQEALGQVYENNRDAYPDDESFSNFRSVSVSNIKENLLYRGASPLDNSRNRASITSSLLEKYGINAIIDLADSSYDINEYISKDDFDSSYAKKLYDEGHLICLSMSSDYSASSYRTSLGLGLKFMLENKGPYYIHCMEGKDRTGFVCFVFEALLASSYDEMCADYMSTYKNYYGVTLNDDYDKYEAIVDLYFNTFVEFLTGKSVDDDLKQENLSSYAREYLHSCQLDDEEINALILLLEK